MASYLITTDQGDTLELTHHGVKGMKWGVRKDRGLSKRQQYRSDVKAAKIRKKERLQYIKDHPSKTKQLQSNRKLSAQMAYGNAKRKAAFDRKGGKISEHYSSTAAKRDSLLYGGKGAARISKGVEKRMSKGMDQSEAIRKARGRELRRSIAKGTAVVVGTYAGTLMTAKAISKGRRAMQTGIPQAVWNQAMGSVKDAKMRQNPLRGTKNARKYARGMARNARKGVEFVSGMGLGSGA